LPNFQICISWRLRGCSGIYRRRGEVMRPEAP
jgi:hypothetical protein